MNDLAYAVFCRLREKKIKISAAESCTGGLFTKLLTDIPGSSEILDLSIVTYANEAKVKFLGVSEQSIAEWGVVSEEVAVQMAEGICRVFGADLGVGITGIAGPGGASEHKPVGLVWTAVRFNGKTYPEKLLLSGNREQIRLKTCERLFEKILEIV